MSTLYADDCLLIILFCNIFRALSTVESYFQRIIMHIRNPNALIKSLSSTNTREIFHRARNLSSSDIAASAVTFAEILGFFTAGEIIGKFQIIGYKGEVSHHH